MKKIHDFCPADRYTYDFGICSFSNGFSQIDTGQDAWYYGNWANPFRLIVFSYCEGDCYATICDTVEEFRNEILAIKKYIIEAGYRFYGIDHNDNKEAIRLYREMGLGELFR